MPTIYPEQAEVYEARREEFEAMIGSYELEPGTTRHFTFSNYDAYKIFWEAYMHDARVMVAIRDGASDTVIPIFVNEDHSRGATAEWIVNEVLSNASPDDASSAGRDIAAYSRHGEIADPDGWVITVYENWRKQ